MTENGLPLIHSFDPIADSGCRVLILGTMPGVASLTKNQYYGHSRNAFWPIMTSLLNMVASLSYEDRCRTLLDHHIALWDVVAACRRSGSADSAIREEIPNDIPGLLRRTPAIQRIYFNGGGAEKLFNRLILPHLPNHQYQYRRLASTSPAYVLPFEAKLNNWMVIVNSPKM